MVILWYYYGNIMVLSSSLVGRNNGGTSEERRTCNTESTKETKTSSIPCFPCSADYFSPIYLPISFFLYIFASVWGCIIRLLHNNPLIISKIAKTKIYQK